MLRAPRLVIALALSASSAAAQVPWSEVELASGLPFASPGAIRMGDLDGDGDVDAVVASLASSTLAWFETRAGQPSVQRVLEANAPGVLALELADIDGDGDLDVLACWSGTLAWLENLGAGASFARRPIPQPFPSAPETGTDALLRDLDGDGDQDLVLSTAANTGGSLRALHVYRLEPSGYVRVATLIGSQDLGRPAFADLDRDGDMDLVAPSASFTPSVWFRNETQLGGPISFIPTGDTPFAKAALPTDFDGDGEVDLVLVKTNLVAWSRNLGGGVFSGPITLVPPAAQPASSFINQGELADLDGDGDDDLLLSIRPTNATSSGTLVRVAWYENDGNGGFGARQDLVADPFHQAFFGFAVGDFDGDGDFDVAASDRTGNTADLVVYLNGSTLGAAVCAGAPNSTGAAGALALTGSSVAAADRLVLGATSLPPNAFGYFIVAQVSSTPTMPPGSQGSLCLGGPIGRFVAPGQIQNTGAAGVASLRVQLGAVPTPSGPLAVTTGDTRAFQFWHRDVAGGAVTSNFTRAVSLTFR